MPLFARDKSSLHMHGSYCDEALTHDHYLMCWDDAVIDISGYDALSRASASTHN